VKFYRTFNLLLVGLGLLLSAYNVTANPASGHATSSHGKTSSATQLSSHAQAQSPNLNQSTSPTAFFDAKGRLWTTWIFGQFLYVNYSDDSGATFSKPVKVNVQAEKISSNPEARPNIVVANNGNVYVSYAQNLKKRFSGNVRFSRSVDGGNSFSAPITVNDNLELIGHSFPVLTVNAEGTLYMAWLDSRDKVAHKRANAGDKDFIGSSVYYAVSQDEGRSFQANAVLQQHSCQCCRISVALDQQQHPVYLWRHIFDNSIRDHALVRFTTETELSSIMRASNDRWAVNACPHHGPSISIDNQDDYHMVWFTQGDARKGSFYAFSETSGEGFSEPVGLGEDPQSAQHPHVLAFNKDVYIVWKSFDGVKTTLFGMKSEDRGRSWGEAYTIAETQNGSDHGFLIHNGQYMFVSWHTADQGYRLLKADPVKSDKFVSFASLPSQAQ